MRVGTFRIPSNLLIFSIPEWAVMPIVQAIDMDELNSFQLLKLGKFINDLDKHKEFLGALDYVFNFDYCQESTIGNNDVDDSRGEVYELKVQFFYEPKDRYRISLTMPEWVSDYITHKLPCNEAWQQKAIDSFFTMFPDLFTRGKWRIEYDSSPFIDPIITRTKEHDLSPFIREENQKIENCHTINFYGIH